MREVAKRVFAEEYSNSDLIERGGNSQYSPTYVITPTGARCNRLFVIGVLTEVENIGKESELYRGRVSDPTGTFLIYAGDFQPEALKFLSEANPPTFIALTGKTNLYEPDEDTSITSIRPEIINNVSEKERKVWVVKTAQLTIERLKNLDEKAIDYYEPDKEYYQGIVKKALKFLLEEETDEIEIKEDDKTKDKNKTREKINKKDKEETEHQEETKGQVKEEEDEEIEDIFEESEEEKKEEEDIEELDLSDL
ncbi:MAG: RPA family protein a subunit of RPA complex [Candidatus Methanohalarchaeum thermophilum]|uniref:RPA family protein a subunit of RPA complex n=1 Tax=Methanohalarchaeum thermophilum TaxID=1903181 RepID=A0A1Q6DUC3_METT1|nr:MAG: RPA family protein a subunit of RPA complex [Candidatus Methanohalarchaeum thermophilum]